MDERKVCKHCESFIPADSKFCPNCGAEYIPEIKFTQENYTPIQPSIPPQPSQSSQTPVQTAFSDQVGTPKKSKRNTFLIVAIIAIVLICMCIFGIIFISYL